MSILTDENFKRIKIFVRDHYDNCSICNRSFIESEGVSLGYSFSNKLIRVGDCCATQICDKIGQNIYMKRPYTIPENSAILWRYMDYTKFISLIGERSLYFSRADKFLDPFEGARGLLENRGLWYNASLDSYRKMIREFPNGLTKSESQINDEADKLLKAESRLFRKNVKKIFINCWHENQYESEAMWKLYTPNIKEGIAIQTTYYKLNEALNKDPNLQIGRVNYLDYSTRILAINESFWFKRKSFEHEKEVRAFTYDLSDEEKIGKFVDVDIDGLIENIYLSPFANKKFQVKVENQLKKHGINKSVNISTLLDKPFF